MLAKRLADAHGCGPFDLAFDRCTVDGEADVVDGDVFKNLHVARIRTDFDYTRVRRERLGASARFFFGHHCDIVEIAAADHFADHVVRGSGYGRERYRLRGRPFDADLFVFDFQIVGACFELSCRQFEELVARVDGGEPGCRAGN